MDYSSIEKKWQKRWEEKGTYRFDATNDKPKLYALEMFSYPSGAKLHLGHWYNFGVSDTWARYKKMTGYNLFHPMGFDAFGLPAENYAIKTGIHPSISTEKNIETMEGQLRSIGGSWSWDHEVVTCREDYYKWTQWMFLELYKHGLAYKKEAPVNFCPSCNTVLANEQVIQGECERCGSVVVRKNMSQWFFKITDYAEELLSGLDSLDWPERTKTLQRNWIGKSNGAYVTFQVEHSDKSFEVFTTRADTLFGCTYCVLAPEHELVSEITTPEYKDEVQTYQLASLKQSEIERTSTVKEKTGVFTGSYAINPVNGRRVPIWISDYVLSSYGTGSIMAVPAHDQRDFEFAKKFQLPIIPVLAPLYVDDNPPIEGKENTERNTVIVVTKYANEYLCVKYKKFDWQTFIMGGIEGEEDIVTAAKRELEEETGYYDIDTIRVVPFVYQDSFYAAHKDVNRLTTNTVVEVVLKSKKHHELSMEEKEIQEPVWVLEEELSSWISISSHKKLLEYIRQEQAFTEDGVHVNSDFLNGLYKEEALETMYEWLEKHQVGKKTTTYKLRDWLVSRQRYWGAPIPIVYCDTCGIVPVEECALPVVLPMDVEFRPDGESPLKRCEEFVNTTCPHCGKPAQREVDTLDTFVCSSWYYLRYIDSFNANQPFDSNLVNQFLPVDKYVGGIEHACMHLLYARFFTKALRDMGYLNFDEPFTSLVHQGLILGPDGEKMSKSRGNTVSPDEYVEEYGADVLRGYLMFGFNYIEGGPWTDDGIRSIHRFYAKVERLVSHRSEEEKVYDDVERVLHKTIQAVRTDIDKFQFNTCISRIMEYTNALVKIEDIGIPKYYIEQLLLLLAPFAPHITEELWCVIGNEFSIHECDYPNYDELKVKESDITIGVQVNGKLRSEVTVAVDESEDVILEQVMKDEKIQKYLEGNTLVKSIIIPNKIVNLIIR